MSATLKYEFKENAVVQTTYTWLVFMKTYDGCLATFHLLSIFLNMQLALWRYLGIVHPLKEIRFCHMSVTRNVILVGYITSAISLGLPTFLASEIFAKHDEFSFYVEDNVLMTKISASVYGVIGLLVTSVLLTFVTYR